MRDPSINDYVVLLEGIEDLSLHPGDVGRVRRLWLAPRVGYEVEFHPEDTDEPVFAIVPPRQVCQAPLLPADPRADNGRSLYF